MYFCSMFQLKKNILYGVIGISVVIVVILVIYKFQQQDPQTTPLTDIVVTNEGDAQRVENIPQKYSILIPQDWVVGPDSRTDYLTLFTPNGTEQCRIEVYSSENSQNRTLQEYYDHIKLGFESLTIIAEEKSEKVINRIPFFVVFLQNEEHGMGISAYFAHHNAIHEVSTPLASRNDSCEKSFNSVLSGVRLN